VVTVPLETVDDYIAVKLVHSIHTSERRSFRGCRRRHNWVFREGYYPVTTAKPLEFGIAFHKGMEKLYDPLTWKDKEVRGALARGSFVQTCDAQFKAFKDAYRRGKIQGFVDMQEAENDYKERKALGLGMLSHYIKNVMPDWDHNFTPVKVEIEFEVAIKGPNGEQLWCKCERCWKRFYAWWSSVKPTSYPMDWTAPWSSDGEAYKAWQGLPVTYGGRFDLLAQDHLGRYWIFDWKTTARMSQGEPGSDDDFLWLDDQITSYCWAMWSIGFPIAGFVYVEIKKSVPTEPEPLNRPYKGRLYPVNRSKVVTTYDMYKKTVEENDPIAYANGLYDEFLDYLRGESGPLHLRHQIHRSEQELEHAGYNIWLEACDITDPKLRIYPSPGRFACNGCAFRDPCMMMNRNEDYEYTLSTMYDKKERHYFEREPSTESKGGE
jgi:hypothetical protein